MIKYIVWANGHKSEARVIEAENMPDAIETAESLLGVAADEVNIIEEERRGAADYYGVADAE